MQQTTNDDGRFHVVVVGTGKMGAGIGFIFAQHGASVTYLVREAERAQLRVHKERGELIELNALPPSFEVAPSFATDIGELPQAHIVVESVPEDEITKRELLADLSAKQPDAIVATNTSSLSITSLAESVSRPDRFVGMHFWYPPMLMPLVELVPGERTAPDVIRRCEDVLRRHGKIPIALRRDIPGFVWNRLQVAVLREAKHLVEAGVVSAGDLDRIVEDGLARRWSITGPFASAMLGGVATFEAVGRNLLPRLASDQNLDGLGKIIGALAPEPDELNRYRNAMLARRPVQDREVQEPTRDAHRLDGRH